MDDNCNNQVDETPCTPGGNGNVTITTSACYKEEDIRGINIVPAASSANDNTCQGANFNITVQNGDVMVLWGSQTLSFTSAIVPSYVEGRCSSYAYNGTTAPGWAGMNTDWALTNYAAVIDTGIAPSYSYTLGNCGGLGYVIKVHF